MATRHFSDSGGSRSQGWKQATARSGSAPAGGRRPRFVSSDLNGRSTTWREKVVFTLPQFSTGIMQLFHDYWLGAFYANEVQLDLGRIALVLSIYAGMHVLLNPVVGWLIDRTKVNRFGRKKPFVLLAAVAQAVCFAQLVNAPAASATSSYKFAWYLGWSMGRGLASLTLATSYYAWAVQLTLNSGDRTFVFGLQRWFWQLGGLIGAAGPPYFIQWSGYNIFAVYRMLAYCSAGLSIVSYVLLVIVAKERPKLAIEDDAPSVVPALIDCCYNVPFRRLMVVYCIWRLIPSLPTVIQNRYLFNLTSDTEQGFSFFVNYVAVAAVLPVWLFASRFMEKRTGFNLSLVAGELLPAVTLVAAPSLPASWVKPAFIFYSVIGALSARVTFEDAMLADCVEYDQLYSGKRREGQYQGAENTLLDFASVFQNAVGFAVLAAAGYKEGAQVQPASVVTSARIVAAVPIVVMFVLQALMMGYRLSKRRHASVVHALQTHQQGRPAVDPLTNAMVPPPDEVDPDALTLVSNLWRFERRLAVSRGGKAAVIAIAVQMCACVAVGVACFVGVVVTNGDSDLSTINNTLLNVGIIAIIMLVFNMPRLQAARQLPATAIDEAAMLRHVGASDAGYGYDADADAKTRAAARGRVAMQLLAVSRRPGMPSGLDVAGDQAMSTLAAEGVGEPLLGAAQVYVDDTRRDSYGWKYQDA